MEHVVSHLCRLAEVVVVVAGSRRDGSRAYDASQAAFVSLDDWRRVFATTEATSVHWYEAGYWLRRHHSVVDPAHPDAHRVRDTVRRFLESLALRPDSPPVVRDAYASALSALGLSGASHENERDGHIPGSTAASRHQSPRRPVYSSHRSPSSRADVPKVRPAIMTPQVSSSLHLQQHHQHQQRGEEDDAAGMLHHHAPRSGAARVHSRDPAEPSVIPPAASPAHLEQVYVRHVEHPSGVVASVPRGPREDRYTSPSRRGHQQRHQAQGAPAAWQRAAMSPLAPAGRGGPVRPFDDAAAQQFGAPQDEVRAMMAAQARLSSAGPWRAIDTPAVEGAGVVAQPHPAPPSADDSATPTRPGQPARTLVGSPRTPPAVSSVSTATPLPVQVEQHGGHYPEGPGPSHRRRERMRVREDPQPRGEAAAGY